MIRDPSRFDALTERNLRRQRRAFHGVDAGRGRINIVKYVAASLHSDHDGTRICIYDA